MTMTITAKADGSIEVSGHLTLGGNTRIVGSGSLTLSSVEAAQVALGAGGPNIAPLLPADPTGGSGFMLGQPTPEQPNTDKLYGDANEAYAKAVAANAANFSKRFRTLRDRASAGVPDTSYRVWPINTQAGFDIPTGWFHHQTPTEEPSPAPSPSGFPPAEPGTHDDGQNMPVDPSRSGGRG